MKKLSVILIIIFIVFILFPSYAGARTDKKGSPFLSNPPHKFTVKGFKIKDPDTHHPYHEFQKTVSRTFTVDEKYVSSYILNSGRYRRRSFRTYAGYIPDV